MNLPDRQPMSEDTRLLVRNLIDVFLILLILLLLCLPAGCAHRPKDLQNVNVAIPLVCQEKEPARPSYPWQALKAAGCSVSTCLDEAVKAMAAEIERREGYETLAITALRACIAPITTTGDKP